MSSYKNAIKGIYRVLEAFPNAVLVVNEDKKIVLANTPAEELFDYDRKQLLGKNAEDLVSECFRTIYSASHSELLGRPRAMRLNLRGLSKGGREFPVEVSLSRVATGENVSILNTFSRNSDSGQFHAESALVEFEKHYAELFENANDIIFTLDLSGNCTSLNRAGEEYSGYARSEALRLNIMEVLPPEYTGSIKELLARVAGGETVRMLEVEMLTKEGRRLPLEVSAKAIYREGKPAGIQGIARDVSERKLLQRQLHQAQRMESLGRLAGGVAHDFNNILTIVACNSELLLNEFTPGDPRRQFVEQIQGAGQKASWLATQLIAFSRKQIRSPKILDLNAVVAESSKMLGRLIGENIQLVTKLDPELGKVNADAGQVEQIIMNLAIHARDAMPCGGRVIIETSNVELDQAFTEKYVGSRPGSYVLLAISDTGPGMDAETQSHIFEPFFATKEEGRETGLGLATVYGIVKQNNGNIWAESEYGRGTTFRVYLPRTQPNENAGVSNRSAVKGGSETILLVEDEGSLRTLIARILRASGYQVLAANNADEALELSKSYPDRIHLLLTDVVIPGINGLELGKEICRLRPGTQVLYTSGHPDEVIARHGLSDADTHFLQKPFQLNEMMRKIRSLLDGC
jgi:two-component system, cell cycle sensor histidine kinase and response regulator CckA